MNNTEAKQQPTKEQEVVLRTLYHYAIDIRYGEPGKSAEETERILLDEGVGAELVAIVMQDLAKMEKELLQEAAKKQMLIGGFICLAGIAATLADIGFIF